MEIKSGDISTFPPEIQAQIKAQMLMQKIKSYGKKIIEVDGKTYEKTGFQGYSNMKEVVDFVELDEGCEMWVKGEKYPMRGCFDTDKVATLTQIKKIIPVLARGFSGKCIIKKLVSLLYLLFNWKNFIFFIHQGLRDVYFEDPKRYSQPVRELYRVLDGEIRDIVCAILENDTAYRYRLQDIFAEINKKEFERHPIKEIKRLWTLSNNREKGRMLNAKGIRLEYIKFLILFPKLIKKLKGIVREINLDEIKLSVEDIYWTNQGWAEYDFRGIPFKTRLKDYEEQKVS
jgi:hypothetical protein